MTRAMCLGLANRTMSLAGMICTNLNGDEAIRYLENHLMSMADIENLSGFKLLPTFGAPLPDRPTALWPLSKSAAGSLAYACAP